MREEQELWKGNHRACGLDRDLPLSSLVIFIWDLTQRITVSPESVRKMIIRKRNIGFPNSDRERRRLFFGSASGII